MYKENRRKGFSLIEMMVAVTLFSFVMLIGIGSLLTLVDANRKAQALKSVMNNLNFALENMSRNLRVGTTYHCENTTVVPADIDLPKDCAAGGVLLGFEGSNGDISDGSDQIVYRYDATNNRLERSLDAGANFIAITAAEVNIEEFNFFVIGTTIGDNIQPRVVFRIRGSAGNKAKTRSEFNLQATVSQRFLDI